MRLVYVLTLFIVVVSSLPAGREQNSLSESSDRIRDITKVLRQKFRRTKKQNLPEKKKPMEKEKKPLEARVRLIIDDQKLLPRELTPPTRMFLPPLTIEVLPTTQDQEQRRPNLELEPPSKSFILSLNREMVPPYKEFVPQIQRHLTPPSRKNPFDIINKL